MLYGELPFDDSNWNTMFKYIKEARYYMKGSVSTEAKDLLNRMIQPNPFRRITINEIKSHPWFVVGVSRYLLDPLKGLKMGGTTKSVDSEIVDQLFTLKLSITEDQRDKIEQAIRKGENHDYCVAYQYLLHAKMMKSIKEPENLRPVQVSFQRKILQK